MIRFKSIPDMDKPRERLFNYGENNLSNEELISIILKTGSKKYSVKEVSLKLLESIDDISKLKDIGISTLMKIDGIVKAAIELGRRVYLNNSNIDKIKLNDPDHVYDYFRNLFYNKKQEYFYCIYLDTKGKYLDKKCLFVGTINNSVIHPREIFKEAYLCSAASIICVHNHPSGSVIPSNEDINITDLLVQIGKVQGVPILDHIIIGNNNYFSFYENNMLER